MTDNYLAAIAYLKEHRISAVAMEAIGVYWIPLFEMLEASGIEVCLVNGKHVKNVPGRKSDVADCEWIRQLYSYGLLRPCFIPEDAIRTLRTYVRLRNDRIFLTSRAYSAHAKSPRPDERQTPQRHLPDSRR